MEVKALIAACLQRNRIGEKLLYDRYVTPMARLCQRYLRNEGDIQDVLIEGFVKVFNNLKTFEYRGEQSLEIWIRQIMINECLMRLRKNKKQFFIDEEQHALAQPCYNSPEAKEIIMLIHQLPAGYRTILNLYVIDGYSHKEIACLLGITESASRSQLTHARFKLKELLNKHGWSGMIK